MPKKETSSQPEILFRADLSGRGPLHVQVGYCLKASREPALVFGYGSLSENHIERGILQLAAALG
jgi:hypothetical protein